jgi:hypothetical protein
MERFEGKKKMAHTFTHQNLGVLSTCFSTFFSQNSRWINTSHLQHYLRPYALTTQLTLTIHTTNVQ